MPSSPSALVAPREKTTCWISRWSGMEHRNSLSAWLMTGGKSEWGSVGMLGLEEKKNAVVVIREGSRYFTRVRGPCTSGEWKRVKSIVSPPCTGREMEVSGLHIWACEPRRPWFLSPTDFLLFKTMLQLIGHPRKSPPFHLFLSYALQAHLAHVWRMRVRLTRPPSLWVQRIQPPPSSHLSNLWIHRNQ